MNRLARTVAIEGVLLGIGLGFAPGAGAFVYWANFDGNSIGRARLDGTAVNQSFIAVASPWGVAVDGSHIYWSNPAAGTIGRANLDGTGADPDFITGACFPRGLAVDGSHIYWGESWSTSCGAIGRANLDGTGVDDQFLTVGNSGVWMVTVAGPYIYWVGDLHGLLGRVDLDGTNVTPLATVQDPIGVAVDRTHVYWSDGINGSIWRAPLGNTSPNQWDPFITGADDPRGLAVEGPSIYWANSTTGSIGRAGVDGSSPNQHFITGANVPMGIAVDAAELSPSSTDLSCLPGSFLLGELLTCTATVSGSAGTAPSGTVSFASDTGGSFSGSASCSLSATSSSQSSCELTYSPAQVGAALITASYDGDQSYASSDGQTQLSVAIRSATVSVDCSPGSVAVGNASTCTATVVDVGPGTSSAPGGTVSFASDSGGSFSGSASCRLSTTSSSQSSCELTYTPAGSGIHTITAYYAGDQAHSWNQGQTSLTVSKRATAASIDCSPHAPSLGTPSICTATIADEDLGTASPPSGSVSFSTDGSGSFGGSGSCTLSPTSTNASRCQLIYTATQIGSATHSITSTYSGDQAHAASHEQTSLTITPPPTKPQLVATPMVSGTTSVGHVLSSSTGAWSGTPPLLLSYQWQRCNLGCVNITGAIGRSYTLAAADAGAKVRILVTARNGLGSAQAQSGQVGPVSPSPAQIKSRLSPQLSPSGKGAKISALLKVGGYTFSLKTPLSFGSVVIDWYYLLDDARGSNNKARPVLVAATKASLSGHTTVKIVIRLTSRGKQMLKTAKRLKLTAKGTVSTAGSAPVIATKTFTLKR